MRLSFTNFQILRRLTTMKKFNLWFIQNTQKNNWKIHRRKSLRIFIRWLPCMLSTKPPKKPVWFMISENYGQYYITMFYDNEYNRANGEDL